MTSGKHRTKGQVSKLTAAVEDAAHRLGTIFHRAQQSLDSRISASQMQALGIIERYGQINVNGLAAELGAIPSSASRLCDRLQAAGLVARTAAMSNRRQVMIVLTKSGQSLLAEASRKRRHMINEIVTAMSPANREALLTSLEEFNRLADHTTEQGRELA